MALGRKTGGRTKGTPNKATSEVKQYAQQFSKAAINELVKIMADEEADAKARVMAANSILDRAHGKPSQEITGPEGAALIPQSIRFVITKAAGADTRQ